MCGQLEKVSVQPVQGPCVKKDRLFSSCTGAGPWRLVQVLSSMPQCFEYVVINYARCQANDNLLSSLEPLAIHRGSSRLKRSRTAELQVIYKSTDSHIPHIHCRHPMTTWTPYKSKNCFFDLVKPTAALTDHPSNLQHISEKTSWLQWRPSRMYPLQQTDMIQYILVDLLPVVPHKAVAEVSRIGNYRRDCLLWVTGGRAKTLMDRTVQLCNWLTD